MTYVSPSPERSWQIFEERVFEGKTFQEIGKKYSLSGTRVRDIVISQTKKLKRVYKNNQRLSEKIEFFKNAHNEISKILYQAEDEVLDHQLTRIDELELSVRTANVLKDAGFVFLKDLENVTEIYLLRLPNFGRKSLNEIRDVMLVHKLRFKGEQ